MDHFAQFKQKQRESWKYFAPLEVITTSAAARLVRFAGINPGMRVLDAGCGTGVVAITAARAGAQVKALDLTPELLTRARENAETAAVTIEWREGDVEELPYADQEFDVVVSQFAHMFAPRPEVAISEMLRVLRPGGSIALATWPPEMLVARCMALSAQFMPPPPPGVSSPLLWGDPAFVRKQVGENVRDLVFDRDFISVPALSPQHFRLGMERSAGPILKLVETLSASDPERLRQFRQGLDELIEQYRRDNVVRQDYLLSRAYKM